MLHSFVKCNQAANWVHNEPGPMQSPGQDQQFPTLLTCQKCQGGDLQVNTSWKLPTAGFLRFVFLEEGCDKSSSAFSVNPVQAGV